MKSPIIYEKYPNAVLPKWAKMDNFHAEKYPTAATKIGPQCEKYPTAAIKLELPCKKYPTAATKIKLACQEYPTSHPAAIKNKALIWEISHWCCHQNRAPEQEISYCCHKNQPHVTFGKQKEKRTTLLPQKYVCKKASFTSDLNSLQF